MPGRIEQHLAVGALREPAHVHDDDAVADHPYDREVVGNKDDAQPGLGLHAAQQFQHLPAHGSVEGGNRLVTNQHFRPENQRPRDSHALRLPAGQLVRVAPQIALVQPDLLERRNDPRLSPRSRERGLVYQERFADDGRHAQLGIQCADRVLEDQLQVAPGGASAFLHRRRERLARVDDTPGRERDQPEHGPHEARLAGARLADDRQRFPGPHRKTDVVDRPQVIVVDHRIADTENRFSRNGRQRLAPVDARGGFDQASCMRMFRRREQGRGRPGVDHPPAFENDHVLAMPGDDAEVVGNQQQRRIVANVFEQLENLSLHGHIECGRRLVGYQQVGLGDQRRREHRPLAHAARHLVRVRTELAFRVRQTNPFEHRHHAGVGLRPGGKAVPQQNLPQLRADTQIGVQRLHRVLEDHADAARPDPVELAIADAENLPAVEFDAARDTGAFRQQAENRQGRLGLARSGFAHESHRLTALDEQVDAVDHCIVAIADREVGDVQQAHGECLASK